MTVDKETELAHILFATHKLNDNNEIIGGVANLDLISIMNPKAGSYKYNRPDTGEEIIVEPNTPMYSTASILAHEMWDGENWINLNSLCRD